MGLDATIKTKDKEIVHIILYSCVFCFDNACISA